MNSPAKNIYVVAKREFTDYFTSPVAYVFLVIFLALCAFFTFQGAPIQGIGQTPFFDLNEASLASFFPLLPLMFLMLVPAIGMRLWSQEKRTGTLELLLTLPITPTEAVLGKFFASWAFLLLALALTFPLWITASMLGSPDHGAIFCGYIGAGLMAGAYLAIGCMTSAMTRDQVVSFILSFTVCGMTFLAGFMPVVEALQDIFPNNIGFVDFIASFSVVTHFESFQQGMMTLGDVVFFSSVIAVSLTATTVLVRLQQGSTTKDMAAGGIQVALVGVAMILLNSVTSNPAAKADLTENNVHTLNQGTLNILERLHADRIMASSTESEVNRTLSGLELEDHARRVKAITGSKLELDENAFKMEMRLYFTSNDEWGRSFKFVREYIKRLEGLLEQLTLQANGDLVYIRINPQPDTNEEELAQKANLYPIPVTAESQAYIGLTLSYGDRSARVPLLEIAQTERGPAITGLMPDEQWEYNIAKAIADMLPKPEEKPVVGLMSPMQLDGGIMPGIPPQMARDPRFNMPPWPITADLRRLVGSDNVRNVPFTAGKIDDEIDVLILVHPKDISDKAEFAIDQFVLRGGKLLAFIDPAHAFERGFMAESEASKSTLPTLLNHWGVSFTESEVVVDKDLGKRLQGQLGGGIWPTALEIHDEYHSKSDPITKNLPPVEGLHFGALDITEAGKANKKITRTVLLESSKNSIMAATGTNTWALSQSGLEKFIASQNGLLKDFKKDDEKKALAMKLTGEFTTAFSEGDPEYVQDANSTAPPPTYLKATNKDTNSMVVLVGDVDVIHQGLFGLTRSGGLMNRQFFLRLVDYLTGDKDLLSIRTATKRTRPLTELKKREEKALESYRSELEKAAEDEEKAIAGMQKILQSISAKAQHKGRVRRTEFGQVVIQLDEKDQAEMDRINDQIKDTRKDFKARVNTIKKEEKQARTSLHNRYKWTNILLVPALTILLGMSVLILRRARVMAQ